MENTYFKGISNGKYLFQIPILMMKNLLVIKYFLDSYYNKFSKI